MISAHSRRTVRAIYAFAWGYCGVAETEVSAYLEIDHFVPVDAGGTDDLDNLVYACHACNRFKAAAWNPLQPRILHPLQSDIASHLRHLDDGTLDGLTPQGTRHIETLHLNRAPMVERRKMRRLIQVFLEHESRRLYEEKQLDTSVSKKKQKIRKRQG